MIRYRTRRQFFRRLVSVLILISISMAFVPTSAYAWKPKTHIFFAEEALKDAIDDGKVTIYKVDYAAGTIGEKLGDYDVDPGILAALKSHPQQYRAGVLGPDAYPDIITGQRVIHPDTSQPDGSNSWLEHLWNSAGSDTGAVKAFVVGYLTHAAGDMYGHTFVNYYTGGEFALGQNAIKHVVLEGYVGKRTPDTKSSTGATVDESQVSIEGVENFIYQYMVRAESGTVLKDRLLATTTSSASIPDGHLTVPYIFSSLRTDLQRDIDNYYRAKARYDRRAARKGQAARDCGTFDFSCSAVALRAQQAAILAQKGFYMASEGPVITYFEFWRDDIDEGLKAWPALSHDVAKALVFNKDGADVGKAQEVVDDYMNDHLLSMAGAPDAVGAVRSVVGKITDMIKPFRDLIDQIKRGLLNYLLKQALGMTVEEIEKYLKNPEIHFDPVMTEEGPGAEVTLANFNSQVLKITDTAYGNPAERFDYTKIPSAYNTVTISKLVLLSKDGMNQLLRDLGSSQTLAESNVMLGFLRSLDSDNQWHVHAHAKMVFAWDCSSYRQVFMRQIGEEGGCQRPEDDNRLTVDSATAAAVVKCREGLTLLTDNMYEHPQQPDASTNGKRSWPEVYKDFKDNNLASCNSVGTFITNKTDDPGMATVKSAMAEDGVEDWTDYWTQHRPNEGSSIYGITANGDRMVTYCPSLHYIQYDCITGPERISISISATQYILDLLGTLPTQ